MPGTKQYSLCPVLRILRFYLELYIMVKAWHKTQKFNMNIHERKLYNNTMAHVVGFSLGSAVADTLANELT